MKRFMVLASLLALVLPITAHATGPAQRFKTEPLFWRTTGLAGVGANLVLADSAYNSNGSTSAQTTYDTTTAFPLMRAELPEYPRVSDTAADSLAYVAFIYKPHPLSGITTGFDSLLVGAQVSMDGISWTNVTPTNPVYDDTRTSGVDKLAILVEPASTANSVMKWYKVHVPTTGQPQGVLSGTAPTDVTLFGWKWIRFIVGDCGYTGAFDGEIGFWSSEGLTGVMSQ